MATPTTTIDALPAVTSVTGTQFVIVQETGVTKKASVDDLSTYFSGSLVIPLTAAEISALANPDVAGLDVQAQLTDIISRLGSGGGPGDDGISVGPTPPLDTDLLWADTTTDGTGDPAIYNDALVISSVEPGITDVLWADTTVDGVPPSMTVAVQTYTDEGDARNDADVVFWIPDPYTLPNPMGALVGDLVLRTTPDVITGVTGTSGIWTGTVTEFDALGSYDDTVIYFVTAG